jgi:phosphopantothenoylcysteine synthetase/decarboxylase
MSISRLSTRSPVAPGQPGRSRGSSASHAPVDGPYLIATPAALDFLNIGKLEALTGHPVRSQYRKLGHVGDPRSLARADAIIVAPATYNTINKWTNGISDNFALGILAEAVGLHIPVAVLPFVNSALASHPASSAASRSCATPEAM